MCFCIHVKTTLNFFLTASLNLYFLSVLKCSLIFGLFPRLSESILAPLEFCELLFANFFFTLSLYIKNQNKITKKGSTVKPV